MKHYLRWKRKGDLHDTGNRHGHAAHGPDGKRQRTPEFVAWVMMKQRCYNPKVRGWKYYGGRGIKVCPEWRDDFRAFLAHIGPRPGPGWSVDRIDPDGNYEPGNVRWATALTQQRNRRDRRRS